MTRWARSEREARGKKEEEETKEEKASTDYTDSGITGMEEEERGRGKGRREKKEDAREKKDGRGADRPE
jgi:hypothetical protein